MSGGMGRGRGISTNVTVATIPRFRVPRSGGDSIQQDCFLSSTVSSGLTCEAESSYRVSSSTFVHKNALSGLPIRDLFHDSDDSDRVSLDASEDDAFSGPVVVEPVPSEAEVENAIRSLQLVFGSASPSPRATELDNEVGHVTNPGLVDQVPSDRLETDWAEPSSFLYNSRMLQDDGSDRFYYAINLLQTDPYVQRMVKSLSSDNAVWDAVMRNEAVQELKESISMEKEQILQGPNEADNSHCNKKSVIMWIFNTVKTKLMEVIKKMMKIVKKLFQGSYHRIDGHAEESNSFNERLRSSFMVSIMVLLIVVVCRVY